MNPKLFIDGTDRTSVWDAKKSRVDGILNSRIDTASLYVDDADADLPFAEWQEVVITNDAETTRYFGGYVTKLAPITVGVGRRWALDCQDYTVLLDKIRVNEIYEDMTAKAILISAFGEYLPMVKTEPCIDFEA